MFSSSPLKRLRQRYNLEPLPEVINVPAIGGRAARSVPIEQATLDDIEFALVDFGRKQSALYEVSNALSTLLRMARVKVAVEPAPDRLRPVEVLEVAGSSERLTAATGWTPQHPLEDLLADILSFWRVQEGVSAP